MTELNAMSETDASNTSISGASVAENCAMSGLNDAQRNAVGMAKRAYDRDHAGAWCTVGGTANAITLTYSVGPAAYVTGEKFAFVATSRNTGATTVNVSGLGAKNVFKQAAASVSALTGNEIQAGAIVELEYDGTQFQIVSGVPSPFAWANISSGGSLNGQNNVTSGTKTGTGAYTVTFTNPAPDANYAVLITAINGASAFTGSITSQSTASFAVVTFATTTGALTDSAYSVLVIR